MASRIPVPHNGTEMSDKETELDLALDSEMAVVHIVDSRFVPPSATLGFMSDRTSLEGAKTQFIEILKSGAERMLKDRLSKVRKTGIKVELFVLGVAPHQKR